MLETGVVLEPEAFGSGASTKKPNGSALKDGANLWKRCAETCFPEERLALDDYVERFLLIDRLSTELRRLEHRLDLRSQFVTLIGP
jgi:hypothetical protein